MRSPQSPPSTAESARQSPPQPTPPANSNKHDVDAPQDPSATHVTVHGRPPTAHDDGERNLNKSREISDQIALRDRTLPSLPRQMPQRSDPVTLASRLSDDERYPGHAQAHPSPPPIAILPQSPSLSATSSLDRSSAVSSPAPNAPGNPRPQATHMHAPVYASAAPQPAFDDRKLYHTYAPSALLQSQVDHHYRYAPPHLHHPSQMYPPPAHIVPSQLGGNPVHHGHPHEVPYPYPGREPFTPILTDDAATKLSDRVRRRCFNCCTTDTSTWRRSSLNPGKVLCNKCGLFERTHSRPRPEQFPHKRGPLATSSLRAARTSPTSLPALPSHVGQLPPHGYAHPSIAPLLSRSDAPSSGAGRARAETLPQIHSWADSASGVGSAPPPPGASRTPDNDAHGSRRHSTSTSARPRSPP